MREELWSLSKQKKNIQIHSSNEADKAAHDFAASIASTYRL
jgi:hypothetical protein